MGGKTAPTNDAVVQQQQQDATDAKQKEADRQARIDKGLAAIKGAFHGTPVMKTTTSPYDWSTFKAPAAGGLTDAKGVPIASGVPQGYTAARVPMAPVSAKPGARVQGVQRASVIQSRNPTGSGRGYDSGGAFTANAGGAGAGSEWGLTDASGKAYRPGDVFDVTAQTDTGQKTGGFDDAFYNKYKQSVLNYYMPQVADQYKDARTELTYRLQRAGIEDSSAANTEVARLSKQNDLNQANVYNQADTAAADLRSQVAGEESKATSQLYATEDPDVAATQATDATRNISLEQPNLSPLAGLFNVATVGGANILKGYNNQRLLGQLNTPLPSKQGSGRSVVA